MRIARSGYQGPGSKTVLPARASAKVVFRLVPETPEVVLKGLRAHLDAEGFPDVRIEFLGGEAPARTNPDDPFVRQVVEEARPVHGTPMGLVPMIGGSGPNHLFVHDLGLPVATAGLGHPDTPGARPQREHPDRPLPQARVPHGAGDGRLWALGMMGCPRSATRERRAA